MHENIVPGFENIAKKFLFEKKSLGNFLNEILLFVSIKTTDTWREYKMLLLILLTKLLSKMAIVIFSYTKI